MRRLFILSISLLIISCGQQKKDQSTSSEKNNSEAVTQKSNTSKQNFAVVWNWTTTDVQLVSDNSITISKELTHLWENGIVENAYYDSESDIDKLAYFPNISFFIKAESYQDAESLLDQLTVVKKGIAQYTIYQVGTLWLKRDPKKIKNIGLSNSYVAVWNTITEYDNSKAKELIKASAKEQSDAVLTLWEKGIVENVYFDIEGTVKNNLTTDFVFFINAKSIEEAQEICNNLPFAKKHLAAYKIQKVGVYWLGIYKK